MVKGAKMLFRVNPEGNSLNGKYRNYPAYFIEILEENSEKGSYDSKGEWYIKEDNFLDVLHDVIKHEREVDFFRNRSPQTPNLLSKILMREELNELWHAIDFLTMKYVKLWKKIEMLDEHDY